MLTIAIVNAGAVRGDHVRPDAEIIADLPDVDVVTAGGEDEIDPTGGKQLQRLFGIRGQEMIGESSVPSKSDATTRYIKS